MKWVITLPAATGRPLSVYPMDVSIPPQARRAMRESNVEITRQAEPADCLLVSDAVDELPAGATAPDRSAVARVVADRPGQRRSDRDGETDVSLRRSTLRERPSVAVRRIRAATAAARPTRLVTDGGEPGPTVTEQEFDNIRAVFEQAPDTILIHDENGAILDANQTAVETLGFSREELLSMRVSEIEVGLSREELLSMWSGPRREESLTIEGEHRHADGTVRPVEVWVNELQVEGAPRFVAIARDVTDRDRYERRLEQQRDDLKMLNQVVRHDIRNDLQLVGLYAELLEDHVDEEGREHLETLKEGVDNAVDLTKTARELAEVMLTTTVDQQTMALDGVLAGQVEEIRESYPSATVVLDDLPEAEVVGNEMLESVFRNLLKNAVQHNPADEPTVYVAVEPAPDRVTVTVLDDGTGIPDAQKDDIFGRGERGLESEGSGIGLYLVRSLVDSFGGDVRVEDAGGRPLPDGSTELDGAAFVVELPRAA